MLHQLREKKHIPQTQEQLNKYELDIKIPKYI